MLTGEIVRTGNVAGAAQKVAGKLNGKLDGSIEQRTERRIRHLAEHPGEIPRRLDEIDREWENGRVLTATAAGLVAIGAVLGATVDRRMFILPAVVAGFMLEHALVGWGPLGLGFRELGFRSADEIAQEKFALKALRGDFDTVRAGHGNAGYGSGANSSGDQARRALEAARA